MNKPSNTYFGTSGELDPGRSLVTIASDSTVLIENCRRIVECSDIRCTALSGNCRIEIWGSDLSASSFSNGSASIGGKISSVEIFKQPKGRSGR